MTPRRRANLSLGAAVQHAEERYIARNPRSRAQFEAAVAVMPGANTRAVLHYDPFPLTLARGEGARLWDLDDHTYTDFVGEFSAGIYGHSEQTIAQALRAVLDRGLNLGGPNTYEAEFARVICERFPSCELVRFCNSGTEANLLALTLSGAATGRSRTVVMDGAYHGSAFYYTEAGAATNAPFPVLKAPFNDSASVRGLLAKHGDDVAAIIVEPMMGSAGCIPATEGFLRTLREEADRCGAVLVFDEVMTSRLAPGGLQERFGILPDLTTLGKYVGGGLSFGALGGRRDLMGRFDPQRAHPLMHSGTYNNDVLTMAAGLAGLTEVYVGPAIERLNALGDRLRTALEQAGQRAGVPVVVTGIGSLMNLHVQEGRIRGPADVRTPPEVRKLLHLELLERGFYTARRGYVSLCLPLTEDDVDRFSAGVEDVLREYRAVLT